MKKIVYSLACCLALVACNGDGGSSSSGNGWVENITPASPNPASGSYNGIPYAQLTQPIGLTSYPSAYLPNNLQIAYGNNNESQIANLTAYVNMTGELCSATPVLYEPTSNTTFLIGAAHCFVNSKSSATQLTSSDMKSVGTLSVYYGVNSSVGSAFQVKAIYLRQDYCYNGTFTGVGSDTSCPNFSPNSGTGTQGNDIAIIQVSGKYATPESYPQVVTASQYPTPYTMAPVLSIGYGINNQSPNYNAKCSTSTTGDCGTMFYVANYQYWQQDSTPLGQGGYHYLYNSYYANNLTYNGYSGLVCGGDSGGGDLFWNGSNWLLLSEHTYGPSNQCGTFFNYLPNGATNVSAYYDWIQSILKDANPVADCNSGAIANCVTNG